MCAITLWDYATLTWKLGQILLVIVNKDHLYELIPPETRHKKKEQGALSQKTDRFYHPPQHIIPSCCTYKKANIINITGVGERVIIFLAKERLVML